MVINFIKWIINFFIKKEETAEIHVPLNIIEHEGKDIALIDVNELSEDHQAALKQVTQEISKLPYFNGKVEHGYELDYIEDPAFCPRCDSKTAQQYATFIYCTQIVPRLMLAPAGYFCTKCPTVIIDEDMIISGINEKFEYRGILGLDYNGKQPASILKTWNDKKLVIICDAHNTPIGVSTDTPSEINRMINKSVRTKKRNSLARESRKKNRKRR